jgi:hypothetical protein
LLPALQAWRLSTPSPRLADLRFDLSRPTLQWLVDNLGNVPAASDRKISPRWGTQSLATIDPACGLADQLFWSASQPSPFSPLSIFF